MLSEYHQEHRSVRLASAKKWRQDNLDKVREKDKRWRDANSVRILAYQREYRRQHPEQRKAADDARRARKSGSGAYQVSGKDLARLTAQGCQHAHYGACSGPMHVDHIVPLARGGRHSIGNLQGLCQRHNTSKGDRLEIEVQVRQTRRATREPITNDKISCQEL